jgi:hypothetical protein
VGVPEDNHDTFAAAAQGVEATSNELSSDTLTLESWEDCHGS